MRMIYISHFLFRLSALNLFVLLFDSQARMSISAIQTSILIELEFTGVCMSIPVNDLGQIDIINILREGVEKPIGDLDATVLG